MMPKPPIGCYAQRRMRGERLAVSVVIPTHNRAGRLAAALESLRAQTFPRESFEVIVVDDASTDGTAALLESEQARGELLLRTVRLADAGGPGRARNEGWRQAGGELVAFTDDDCVADPGWLEAGVAAWGGDPHRFVEGATRPNADELDALGPRSYTYDVREQSLEFSTCNMFYPRALLDRLRGFDASAFPVVGEDSDLAWRAQSEGARPVFAERAVVSHAVVSLGPAAALRRNWGWGEAVLLCARHADLRRRRLLYRLFWNRWHWYVARFWVAVLLPWRRALWPLKLWLGRPWVRDRIWIPRTRRRSLRSLLWHLLADTVEVLGMVRGSLRHGRLVL
jgi:glycosyltransferase involved in cell wall biosynthesis